MQKYLMVVLVLFATISLPMVVTPAWAAGGHGHGHVATFAQTYSAPGANFRATSVGQTTDGGFIVAGFTSSPLGLQTWLLRLDATSAILWQKGYAAAVCGGCFLNIFRPQAVQTPDGGFVVGSVANISSTISPNALAVLVFKVDSTGNLVWQKAFTGLGIAVAFSIDLASDGGIVVAGATNLSLGPGVPTALALKLDSTGGLLWEKTYGEGFAFSIRQTSDGGFVVSGGPAVVRLNSDGSILWQNSFAGLGGVQLFSVQETSDGGFIAAGFGPQSTLTTPGGLLVIRLDSTGAPVWEKNFGGAAEGALSIEQTSDGGFVVAGVTGFSTSSGMAIVLRLDSSGGIVWQRAFSGPSAASWVQQTSDGGFVVAGATAGSAPSTFGAVALVFKLNSMGEIHPCKDLSNTSLATATLSAPPTSITGGSPVDITSTSPGTTTTFTSSDTSATSTVLCR